MSALTTVHTTIACTIELRWTWEVWRTREKPSQELLEALAESDSV